MTTIYKLITSILLILNFISNTQQKEISEVITEPTITETLPIQPIEEQILEQMTTEEKVGQLFLFGFDGTTLNKETTDFMTELNIGGVLLLSKNIANENQLKQLTNQIQNTNKIPLLISIDQEGGTVARIRWNDILTKPQKEISTSQQGYDIAIARGQILKELGINMNLAPVVEYITDTNSFLYDRVYRGTKDAVLQKSISSVKGYAKANIISVIKHYPGHSDTSPDSHYDLPVVKINKDQWDTYVQPFCRIIEQTTVEAVMVGHIQYPNIDTKASTISKEIINNRLIQDLEYEGLVISDDMEMGALENMGTHTSIAKQALEAGNDILIYSKFSNRYPTIQRDVYEYIVEEVTNKNMDIDNKVLKILKVKIKYGILNPEDIN